MSFLTPLAALVGLAALLPLGAGWLGRRRVGDARDALRLPAPSRLSGSFRLASAAIAVALLGLAAAQPVLTHRSKRHVRTDAQALFVLDTSRSMAASATSESPTRLDRAVDAAVRLRAAIPGVAAGVATLTDRVLPDLLPLGDVGAFDRVATRAVGIERPPPRNSSVRATALGALSEIASGDYFDQAAKRRLVVVLTDGESNPVNAGELARSLPEAKGYRLLAVRFWNAGESVFGANGKPEPGYRPDPAGRAILAGLARAAGGKSFEEGGIGSASSYVKGVVGGGPTRTVGVGQPSTTPLAPYIAALALVFLVGAFWPVRS